MCPQQLESKIGCLGFLWRNLSDCNITARAATFTTMVTSIMEYAAYAWDPYLQKDIQQQVQHRAARFTFKTYPDRTPDCMETVLQDLSWEKVKERRKASRLIILYQQWAFWNWQITIPAAKWHKNPDPTVILSRKAGSGSQNFFLPKDSPRVEPAPTVAYHSSFTGVICIKRRQPQN